MSPNNVTEFVLLGFTQNPHLQKILFMVFLSIFLFTLLANLFIVITISLSPTLLAPMYFFLTHLPFLDASFNSVTTPKITIELLYQRTIVRSGCMTQLFLEHFLGGSEIIVLIAMACDHYVAICNPCTTEQSRDMGSASTWWWWPGLGDPSLHCADSFHLWFDLLWTQCHWSLHVWFLLTFGLSCRDTYRLRILVATNSRGHVPVHFFMLLISYIVIPEIPGLWRMMQSPLYLWLPLYGSSNFHCPLYIHLHATHDHLPCRQFGDNVLCNPHSHVKPSHLHSEKQRGEKCHKDFDEKESNPGCSWCLKSEDLYT